MRIAIVTHTRVVSHYVTAQRIRQAISSKRVKAKIYDFEARKIPERNVLYIGTVYSACLSYLSRFLPEKKVVLYGTCEGFPIIDAAGMEMHVAEQIEIIPVSSFVKMCLETVGFEPTNPIYHGLDMKQTTIDERFSAWLWKHMKEPVALCVSGNTERKGLDRYIVACKLASINLINSEPGFILHSGEGFVKIPGMIQDLQVRNLWYTNSFGMLSEQKINSFYDLCRVLVQPSYCEGFGLPMIEAFRFNKPVIAVNAQPYNEIVEDGKTGLLIPVKDVVRRKYLDRFLFPMHTYSVDDLANAMSELLSDENRIKEMSSRIEEEKMRFDVSKTYPKILEYF